MRLISGSSLKRSLSFSWYCSLASSRFGTCRWVVVCPSALLDLGDDEMRSSRLFRRHSAEHLTGCDQPQMSPGGALTGLVAVTF